jgi:hypothetical protein
MHIVKKVNPKNKYTMYYMGVINTPIGECLQTSGNIKDAKKFDTKEEAAKVLPSMGKYAEIEQVN